MLVKNTILLGFLLRLQVIQASPEGFYKTLHFLSLTLNANVCLKLSQSLIQLHAGEIHLVHNTAEIDKWTAHETLSILQGRIVSRNSSFCYSIFKGNLSPHLLVFQAIWCKEQRLCANYCKR